MNKLTIIFCFFLTSIELANAQFVFNERTPEDQMEIDEFGEKLVELALQNNPDYQIADQNSLISKKEEILTKKQWLDQLTITGNLNEFAINPPDEIADQNLFFPRYNIAVQIPLGIFLRQPMRSRIAEKQYQISLLTVEGAKASIRKEVLTSYNNYLLQKDLYDIQEQRTQDSKAFLQAKENSFASGEIDLSEYDATIRSYQRDIEVLLRAQNNLLNAELTLEQWIGMELEDVK